MDVLLKLKTFYERLLTSFGRKALIKHKNYSSKHNKWEHLSILIKIVFFYLFLMSIFYSSLFTTEKYCHSENFFTGIIKREKTHFLIKGYKL